MSWIKCDDEKESIRDIVGHRIVEKKKVEKKTELVFSNNRYKNAEGEYKEIKKYNLD